MPNMDPNDLAAYDVDLVVHILVQTAKVNKPVTDVEAALCSAIVAERNIMEMTGVQIARESSHFRSACSIPQVSKVCLLFHG